MLTHLLAVLGLTAFAHETWRTVQNFGHRRSGFAGGAVELPAAHMAMALLLGLGGFFGLSAVPVVPVYAGPGVLLISAVYFGAALRYKKRRAAERKAKKAK